MGSGDRESDPSSPPVTGQHDATHLGDAARSAIREHASPEGIVTILFTDIVESTRFRQRLGDHAAQERFRQHNQVVREQIRRNGGFEVKTQGDGFMVAFSDVVAALACTVDIQRAVAEDNEQHPNEPLLVRMGLNSGQSIKEEEDFFGGVVIVAARISAMARGGEILVSEAVRVLAGLPPGIGYGRHGRHRLKGLAGSYSIWSVPWGGEEASGFARLWAKPAFRLAVLTLIPVVVGAAVVGAFVLRSGDGESGGQGAVAEELTLGFSNRVVMHIVSGDCVSEDAVSKGEFEGEGTGDIVSRLTGTTEYIGHAVNQCQTGFLKTVFTGTDTNGNTYTGTLEGPLNGITLLAPAPGQGAAIGSSLILTFTRGTGIFEGVTGSGTCDAGISAQFAQDGSGRIDGLAEGTCKARLATRSAPVAAGEPLVVQLAASPLKVTVSGDTFDPASTVGLAVVYGNAGDDVQKGLSLRLPVPPGAEILAAAIGEAQTVSAGERIWTLPDLAPGELQRFELRLRFLKAESPSAPLTVEIHGEGFDQAILSNAITIEIVR